MTEDHEITGMFELLDAVEEVIKASDPAKREALARVVDAYCEDFPDDFFWSVGAQAPTLLSHLMQVVDFACRAPTESKSRVVRLVDRKPEGNA